MAEKKFDFKKEYPDLYSSKALPSIVDVPAANFIMVAGTGDPNVEGGTYQEAIGILYGLTFSIKMSKMSGNQPTGYFEYVVPPLEGLWWTDGIPAEGLPIGDQSAFSWIAMIRQPDFVTPETFDWAVRELSRKKPQLDTSPARFESYREGLCAQVLHKGPYDDEPATVAELNRFIESSGYETDISDARAPFPLARRHHEIYLGDPRKSKPENLKTILRHPVRKAEQTG